MENLKKIKFLTQLEGEDWEKLEMIASTIKFRKCNLSLADLKKQYNYLPNTIEYVRSQYILQKKIQDLNNEIENLQIKMKEYFSRYFHNVLSQQEMIGVLQLHYIYNLNKGKLLL